MSVSAHVKRYGLGRYDIGPYAKEYIYQTEANPTQNWTERPDTTAELWIKVNDGIR